jgi:hypothetical protein
MAVFFPSRDHRQDSADGRGREPETGGESNFALRSLTLIRAYRGNFRNRGWRLAGVYGRTGATCTVRAFLVL